MKTPSTIQANVCAPDNRLRLSPATGAVVRHRTVYPAAASVTAFAPSDQYMNLSCDRKISFPGGRDTSPSREDMPKVVAITRPCRNLPYPRRRRRLLPVSAAHTEMRL